ncbi:hypothetical protein H6G96_32480 [Nostoc sp. FACHB-892]|uniref:hypothetical protein n=1 Tax=Nostoc sp. FACHB-892 TaxID=2692843 RepID=UPI0016823CF3|nr:hypothetical protein [Nostoc sp. FACHB-892]MBD2730909.1 hypothetical protein [Nostoc sp. FACHB-892]
MKKYFSSPRLLKKIVHLSSIFFTVTSLSYLNVSPATSQSAEGFYKQRDRPEVYLIFNSSNGGFYCHVQNEDQMKAYGGFGRVSPQNSLNFSGRFTGDCGWPNGFFRRSDRPAVYHMTGSLGSNAFKIGDLYCRVRDEAQMARYGGFGVVSVVSPSSNLGRGRNFRGTCPNP